MEKRSLLVVDDNAALCRSVRRLLERSCDITFCIDAREALHQLGAGARFDVILCDVRMPGFPGLELYRALETAAPDVKSRVLFMSGATAGDPDIAAITAATGRVPIAKPFDVDALRAAVAGVAQAQAPGDSRAA